MHVDLSSVHIHLDPVHLRYNLVHVNPTYVHLEPVYLHPVHGPRGIMLCVVVTLRPYADTYEVRNAAQGPHKGSKFVSAETGAPGLGRLRRRHRVQTMTDALKFLGLQSTDVQTRPIGTVYPSDVPVNHFTIPNISAAC